jgi:23S rRNA (uracil1939-C5)-methyltransferase
VEGRARALRAGAAAAQAQGLRADFMAEDVARALRRLLAQQRRFDLVVLDPPRAGARDVLSAIVELAPRVLAYVACDPVTLARDLKWLCANGYRLEAFAAYDMFPHTHHVETLVWLSRVR